MKILARAFEKKPADLSQHGISKISIQRRHGSGLDAAAKPVPHDQIVTIAQAM